MSAFWWFGVLVFLPLSLNAAQLRNFDQIDLFHLGLSHTTPATVLSATAFASNYSGDVSSGSSINSSVGAVSGVKAPIVYFLFLATDKISNFRIWQAFFTQAHPDQYRVLVHCKFDSCKSMVAGSVFEAVCVTSLAVSPPDCSDVRFAVMCPVMSISAHRFHCFGPPHKECVC